jgi:hypothetical protein
LDRWDSETCSTTDILSNVGNLLQNTQLRSRLMYGSDWMMLDNEPQNQRYYQSMKSAFGPLLTNAEMDGFLGGTAVSFLGLHSGDRTRQRVDAFYKQNGKPSPFDGHGI